MAGQVAYHLLAQSRATHAPWGVTTAVSCLPVLVLGMGAALAHLLRADAHQTDQPGHTESADGDRFLEPPDLRDSPTGHSHATAHPDRLAEAHAVAAQLATAGQRISRRSLRRAGIRGSNADLGFIARIVKPPATQTGERSQGVRRNGQPGACSLTAASGACVRPC